jgi:hypothetical protein
MAEMQTDRQTGRRWTDVFLAWCVTMPRKPCHPQELMCEEHAMMAARSWIEQTGAGAADRHTGGRWTEVHHLQHQLVLVHEVKVRLPEAEPAGVTTHPTAPAASASRLHPLPLCRRQLRHRCHLVLKPVGVLAPARASVRHPSATGSDVAGQSSQDRACPCQHPSVLTILLPFPHTDKLSACLQSIRIRTSAHRAPGMA